MFNNDVFLIVVGAAGSQTYYSYGVTITNQSGIFTNPPDPTSASASAPSGYIDGLSYSQAANFAVAQASPDIVIKAIGEKNDGSPNSAISQARFQFIVGNPVILGGNAASFTISDITSNARLFYTLDGSDPSVTNPAAFDMGALTGTNTIWNLSFAISSDTLFKARAFRNNYQPSLIVSNLFTKAAFQPNTITFGTVGGEPHSQFAGRPGQFYYAPVTLQLANSGKMYSLQFNVAVTNGFTNIINGNSIPPIVNGSGINFFPMLMTSVKPDEGQYFPPADGSWYLPIPPLISQVSSGATNFIPSAFVNTNNNILGVGWLYRTGIKYTASDTNGNIYLDFDTTKQDLISYSIAHDTLFAKANGLVVVGAYSFQIPSGANLGDQYFIQLGSPSATSDGVGAPGAGIYIQPPVLSQAVSVSSPAYLVGDAAPFHWLNAGDFGDTNLDNSDVMQVYQSAILGVNMPPANSDIFLAMDSCGDVGISNNVTGYYTDGGPYLTVNSFTNITRVYNYYITNDIGTGVSTEETNTFFWLTNVTITPFTNIAVIITNTYFIYSNGVSQTNYTAPVTNPFTFFNYNLNNLANGNDQTINTVAFGDGQLDVNDLYVTFRRSLDPSLLWFKRYWTNGQFVAVTTPNLAFNTNTPHILTSKLITSKAVTKSADFSQSLINFSAGDAVASAGGTVTIPISATILGSYPLRVLGLDITVEPLDGAPAITNQITFTPAAILGSPSLPSVSKGAGNFNAAWLNSSISGMSNSVVLGTLTVKLPPNANGSSAYAVHFDFASGSPNGLAVFPKTKFTGLISTTARTASYYNDGIPDSWRLRWFGTIYNSLSQSNACASGDSINNWNKYIAGVDPTIPNSFPKVNSKSSPPSGYTAAIHWPSVSGKKYVIERSSTLFGGSWSVLTTNTGTGGDVEYDDTYTNKVKFYRVRILP